jgi:hypothetical protein
MTRVDRHSAPTRVLLFAIGLATLPLLGGCPPPECETGPDCTGGQICVSNACEACAADAECVAYGSDYTCTNGACTAPVTCDDGDEGCACFANNTCNGDLVCDNGTCTQQDCTAGDEGCECFPNNTCNGSLECQAGTCVDPGGMMDGGDPPCPAGTRGCECDNNTCLAGGVCGDDDVCRDPVSCDNAGCVANQVCTPSAPGTDAVCDAACVPGYTWNGVSCDADVNANCDVTDAGAPANGSIADDCTNQNRECDAGPPAACGDCLAGNVEHEGVCEAPYQCSNLNCASTNEECIEGDATTDAECGNCLPGYYRNTMGVCVLGASCTPGAIDDITASCTAQNRVCDDSGAQAQCGDCVDGTYVDLGPGPCQLYVSCQDATLSAQCAAENRNCDDTVQGDCTTCLDTYVEVDGNCLPTLCADFDEAACMGNQSCQPGDVGTNMPATCGGDACLPDQALNPQNGNCVPCDCWNTFPDDEKEGLTGIRYPEVSAQGECFCETLPGWFFDGSSAQRCDLDDDGWVRQSARAFMLWPEGDVRRQAAKCGAPSGNVYTVPTISTIRMVNELGETKTVTVSPAVEVYESDRNDDQAAVDADATAPRYGADTVNHRRLTAKELNSFTKACVAGGDYNDNEASDSEEYQGQTVVSTLAGAQTFTRYSYFIELASGRFDPASPGTYIIEERARTDDVPFNTGSGSTYWQTCARKPDADFVQATEYARTNDFAGVSPCGFDAYPACAPGDSIRFVGMNHHSQFKCVTISTAIDTSPNTITPTDFTAAGHYMNTCFVPTNDTGTDLGMGQPTTPPVDCETATTQNPPNNSTGFAVMGFAHDNRGDAYERGCVNECSESTNSCPHCALTYDNCAMSPTMNLIQCQVAPDTWGMLPGQEHEDSAPMMPLWNCGCDLGHGGNGCEVACPEAYRMTAGDVTSNPRTGYWMCLEPTASSGGPMTDGTYTLRGRVPISATDRTPMTDGTYTIR